MTLYDKLITLYPDADPMLFGLADNGDGIVYIELWQQPFPQPTQAELDGVTQEMINDAAYSRSIPAVVTMRQARRALSAAGMLSNVDAAINSIADQQARETAQIEWEYATEVRRDYPWLQTVAGLLGLTDEQLDELFLSAAGF